MDGKRLSVDPLSLREKRIMGIVNYGYFKHDAGYLKQIYLG